MYMLLIFIYIYIYVYVTNIYLYIYMYIYIYVYHKWIKKGLKQHIQDKLEAMIANWRFFDRLIGI